VGLLEPFRAELKFYSPRVPPEVYGTWDIEPTESLEELFAWSQVLVEAEASTPETYRMVEERHLRMLPEGACFVNIGRGAVVDEDGLIRVAAEGKIQIGLDVYDHEPLSPESPLRGMRNVNLLPHIGGPTRERRERCGGLALRNLKRFIEGQRIPCLVDLEIYDRST
jgi:phosphoglycerate dehydrogenase-like enzyme